jgi:acyl-CoA hydrolase
MPNFKRDYSEKLMTSADLVGQFRPGQVIQLGTWSGEPYGVINAINEAHEALEGVHISSAIATAASPYMENSDIPIWTAFYGSQERTAESADKHIFYTPMNFTDGICIQGQGRPLDYYIFRVGPMNERGFFNCSMTAGAEFRVLHWLKKNRPDTTIVFEVNERLPYVQGLEQFGNNELSIELADVIVEDDAALLDYPVPPPNETELAIAKNVANLVDDRDTVQLGFGTIPMAIGGLLAEQNELGIHTEMLCEAHIDLLQCGAATNAHKGLYDGLSVATFALGTKKLHEWIENNPSVAILPVEETNRVDVHAKIKNLASINSVLSVDMTGQTMAHCIGPNTYSGLGGAFEFAYGASLSPGGKSMVCLPSTTTLKDGTVISNIVSQFPKGTRITTPEHVTDWVITEYGAVQLKALSLDERAHALLQITHPDFRESLEKEMHDSGANFQKARSIQVQPPNYFRSV